MILVQTQDFDIAHEYQQLRNSSQGAGAIVFFVGLVRDIVGGNSLVELRLEHYPAMTQRYLDQLAAQAKQRWSLQQVRIIHRVGSLGANDQIVFVGVSSAHRSAAFDGAEFIMDKLKTQAPFWKKEIVIDAATGQHKAAWVEAKEVDADKAQHWDNCSVNE